MEENHSYYITDVKSHINSDAVYQLFQQAYWAKHRTKEQIRRAVDNSACWGAFEKDSGRLIGFARAVTDYATMYYLADVIIDEQYRGMGIGSCLVNAVAHDVRFSGMYGVLLTKDADSLYEKYGFGDAPEKCMVRFDKEK